jgi:hypothetical protein
MARQLGRTAELFRGVSAMEAQQAILQLLPLLIPVILIQFGLMVVALIDLLRRERVKLLPKWAWLLIVVFVGLIGPIVYLLVGRAE